MFVANKVLFMMTEEKPLKLLALVAAFVRWKFKKYIFYGVNICDKNSSIVNIKEGISDKHEAIKNGKIFGGKILPLLFTFITFIRRN